jgi:hypothetical protein
MRSLLERECAARDIMEHRISKWKTELRNLKSQVRWLEKPGARTSLEHQRRRKAMNQKTTESDSEIASSWSKRTKTCLFRMPSVHSPQMTHSPTF